MSLPSSVVQESDHFSFVDPDGNKHKIAVIVDGVPLRLTEDVQGVLNTQVSNVSLGPRMGNFVQQLEPMCPVEDERRYTQARGNKIQRYTPDGQTLLKTYPGCAEVLRDDDVPPASAGKLREACQNRTVYKGFRWAALDRALPDDTVQDIGESVFGPTQRKGLVALLDHTRTKIRGVYADMKAAAEEHGMKGSSCISTAISRESKSCGGYWAMWHDCDESVRAEWLAKPGNEELPRSRPRAGSKEVEQVHPVTGRVIKTFSSIAHIQTEMRIARASLLEAINTGALRKGYKWRYLEQSGRADD